MLPMDHKLHSLIRRAAEIVEATDGSPSHNDVGRETEIPPRNYYKWKERDVRPEGEYQGHKGDAEKKESLAAFVREHASDAARGPSAPERSAGEEETDPDALPEQEWVETGYTKTERDGEATVNSQWSYAYDPEEHEKPEVGEVPVNTPDDVRARFEIDETFVATRQDTKAWTTAMKVGEGEGVERPLVVQNFSINVTFERSEQREDLQSFVDALKDDAHRIPVPDVSTYTHRVEGAPYAALLDLADPHIGKYVWAEQTGRTYDLATAESIYKLAVDRILDKLGASRSLHHVYVTIGHDGSHIDQSKPPATTSGTPQSTDGKFAQISRVCRRCYRYAIERAVEVAPVKVVVIPGNHDERDAWYAGEIMKAFYRDFGYVEVLQGNAPTHEKVDQWGNNAWMFLHGRDMKVKKMPSFFSNEYREVWGKSPWREVITGDKHKRTRHTPGDFRETNGCIVRISPSLAAPGAWSRRHGYVDAVRGSQCLTWHKVNGYDGDIPFNLIDEESLPEGVAGTI